MFKEKGILGTINMYLRRNKVGEILVARGVLLPHQLKEALKVQKQEGLKLGHVLLQREFISSRELHFALASQSLLRTLLAVVTILGGLNFLIPKQAIASGVRDIPSSISVAFASVSVGGEPDDASTSGDVSLFGTAERSSGDLSAFTKWTAMFDRFSGEVNDGTSAPLIQKWRKDLSSLRGLPLSQMASQVNDMMNKVKYIGDTRNWGKSDYWETPVEFLGKGGDCEDFAIAKYVSLRALGVPDKFMRIAIVRDLQKGIPHAILVVYTKNGPMVLDNQIKHMVAAGDIHHYKPIFSINQTAWWLHTDRNRTNPAQIASASH